MGRKVSASKNDVGIIADVLLRYTTPSFEALITECTSKRNMSIKGDKCMKYLIPDMEIFILDEFDIRCESIPGMTDDPDQEGNDIGNMDDLL